MSGDIVKTLSVECLYCPGFIFAKDERQYTSPVFDVEFVADLKKKGWKLTRDGWVCDTCSKEKPAQSKLPFA